MKIGSIHKSIIDLLARYFGIKSTELTNYYLDIESSYNSDINNSSVGFLSLEKFSKIKFQNEKTINNWENASLIGVDIPLFINNNNTNSETVVIIGIDPLRKRKDFNDFDHGNVILGTPYALHSKFYREKRSRTKSYYYFVKHLVSKGYNVYLTDIFKIWMNDFKKTEKDRFFLSEETFFYEILITELEFIQPKVIVAFGDLVEEYLKKIKLSEKFEIIKLPHPSGSNNKKWKTILKEECTCDKKIMFLCSEIDKYLKN